MKTPKEIVKKITDELEECEVIRTRIKSLAMVYQRDLKESAAHHFKVPPETYYYLPFAKWEEIRRSYIDQRDGP